jgi:hypothetical protein
MKTPCSLSAGLVVIALTTVATAQSVYHPTPDWISSDTQVSTGAALVDLDRDGWLDLVVANGNDMAIQRLVVYYNQGDGTFPSMPGWQSSDTAYNGHLDVADVNGDGWPDVAVAYLGEFNTVGPIVRLYLNNAGTLSATPDWTADIDGNAFGAAFGDANSDGRPDLAVATGWAYSNPNAYRNYVYMNSGGQLEATASWQSDDLNDYMDVMWLDANQNRRLDLLGVGANTDNWIYRNSAGGLETSAIWRTSDNSGQFGIMATAGDVTGDGLRDLFVTDNTQIFNGTGHFRQYTGLPGRYFTSTPTWSYYEGYGSAVALADVNADGHLDLATGAWWDRTRLFFNNGSGLGVSSDWDSGGTSVVEKIVFGDIDKNGLRPITESFAPPEDQRLFYLGHQPIQDITSVSRDGVELQPSEFTCSRQHGWVSVGVSPTAELVVAYTYSSKLDMAISNWDSGLGNYVYYNQLVVEGDANCDGTLDLADLALFVLLLTDRQAYEATYPDCDVDTFCDMNGDGVLNGNDVQLLVDLLLSSP